MTLPVPISAHLHSGLKALRKQVRLVLVPTLLATACGGVYVAVRPVHWKASQALLVREEAGAGLHRSGRFESSEAMKSAQETIVELSKNEALVAAALADLGPPSGYPRPDEWPSRMEVEQLQRTITVTPPKGSEFGRSEVIYLSAEGGSREETIRLTEALCRQLESRLQGLRDSKAQSIIDELAKAVTLSQADLDTATAQLETIEKNVGSDLGELRLLSESGTGESNLRQSLNQIKEALRQVQSSHDANEEQHKLMVAARQDPDRLLSAPSRLLELQPALRRLKDGLVDAQLRTAQLIGKMSDQHPEVQAARAGEDEVRRQLNAEVEVVVDSLSTDMQVSGALIRSLEEQLAATEDRLSRLAALRARYSNLAAEVRQRGETLEKSRKDLADARANQAAAHSASVIHRLDKPVTGNRPTGPSSAVLLGSFFAGGLATGLGLVLLLNPSATGRGRRWSDRFSFGRRAADRLVSSGAAAVASVQPAIAAAAASQGGDRRGGDRRGSGR